MDGHRILPRAASPQRLSRHQRHSTEDAAEVLPQAGRDCAQVAVWHRLARAGGARDWEEPCGVSRAGTERECEGTNPEQNGAGDLAGMKRFLGVLKACSLHLVTSRIGDSCCPANRTPQLAVS